MAPHIIVSELVGGNAAMTRPHGRAVAAPLHTALKDGQAIEFDFTGVKHVLASFLDEVFGPLLEEWDIETLNARISLTGFDYPGLEGYVRSTLEQMRFRAEHTEVYNQAHREALALVMA